MPNENNGGDNSAISSADLLFRAVTQGRVKLAWRLLEGGYVSLDEQDSLGRTVFDVASNQCPSDELMDLLITFAHEHRLLKLSEVIGNYPDFTDGGD